MEAALVLLSLATLALSLLSFSMLRRLRELENGFQAAAERLRGCLDE